VSTFADREVSRSQRGRSSTAVTLDFWLDNIRMDLGEVGWGDVDWSGLAQDKDGWRTHVFSVMNIRIPQNAGKLSSGLTTGGLSSSAELQRVS
jgi:hypothetical protein